MTIPKAWNAEDAKSMCVCGHTGDGHNSLHAGATGHGPCLFRGCECGKFTWSCFTPEYNAFLEATGRVKGVPHD